jgi:hypothetical protein
MATRVDAAILDRVREEELAERIQCFLLVEKRTKPIRVAFLGCSNGSQCNKYNTRQAVRRFHRHGFGLIAGFWENPEILSRVYV